MFAIICWPITLNCVDTNIKMKHIKPTNASLNAKSSRISSHEHISLS